MLKSGAEIHIVEESICMICAAYGAAHVEAFAITSLIVASLRLENGEYSVQIRECTALQIIYCELKNSTVFQERSAPRLHPWTNLSQ